MVSVILILLSLPLIGFGFVMVWGLDNPEILKRTREKINYSEMTRMEKTEVEENLNQIRKQATGITIVGITIIVYVIFLK